LLQNNRTGRGADNRLTQDHSQETTERTDCNQDGLTMAKKVKNQSLGKAQGAKQDEFYTQLGDISNELKHYKVQLRDKTILCNCDDPFESNFFKYFALNFNTLGLKKLIATSYKKSPIVGRQLQLFAIEGLKPEGKEPYAIEINEVPDQNGDGAIDIADVEYLLKHDANTARTLKGDETYSGGDFRSRECVELLKQSDIVITNPPFSLFREYLAQLITHDGHFLIIGNQNAISYKEVFNVVIENKVWLGNKSGDMEFKVPNHYEARETRYRVDADGQKWRSMGNACWFTNLDLAKRHEEIPLYKKYTPAEYPKYCNYDAIEVSKVADIPVDYSGAMGVPITFLDKYNPEQFVILGSSRTLSLPMSQIAPKGSYLQGGPRFYLDNGDGTYRRLYDRIVIRNKRP
jgi:hypothetical protein